MEIMKSEEKLSIISKSNIDIFEVCEVLLRARKLVILILNLDSNIPVK